MYYRGQKCPKCANDDRILLVHFLLGSATLTFAFGKWSATQMIAADSAEMQFGRHSHVLGTFVPDSTYPLMQMS